MTDVGNTGVDDVSTRHFEDTGCEHGANPKGRVDDTSSSLQICRAFREGTSDAGGTSYDTSVFASKPGPHRRSALLLPTFVCHWPVFFVQWKAGV